MIEAKNIVRSFKTGGGSITVLKGINIDVQKAEFLSIIGRSGAGKSTLIYQLGLLDTPTEGEIRIDGQDVMKLDEKEKTTFRLTHMGYIFQDYAILPELTALENVALPVIMRGEDKDQAYKKSEKILKTVGLGGHLENLPSQLSGGEQQRVSIARAVASKPKILFADEPTANLDLKTAKQVMDLLKELNKAGQTIVMVTHEQEYADLTDRIIELRDGVISKEKKPKK